MSQENVEIVRTAAEAFNRRDLNALATVSSNDLEIVSTLTANLGGASYHGRDAWVSYYAAMDESWEDWRIEDFEVLDARDDRVACVCRLVGRGQDSGVSVDRAVGMTYRLLDARLWRIHSYLEPAEAFETAGPEPTAASRRVPLPEEGGDEPIGDDEPIGESDARVSRRGFFAAFRRGPGHPFRE